MNEVSKNTEELKTTPAESDGEISAEHPADSLAIGRPSKTRASVLAVTAVAVFVCLYLTSLHSYLLFHSFAETFSIVVACAIFFVAWNTRAFLGNNYLLFLGIAYLFVAGFDFLHLLSYEGMGVFRTHGANVPTQLWIAARFLESVSLLLAPLFLDRKLKPHVIFLVFLVAFGLLVASIFFWGIFPVCYVEGVGLTTFKKISEYVISLMLIGSIVLLMKNRSRFESEVLNLIIWSIVCTIGSELSLTFYVSVYGFSNLVGHYLKIVSFFLLYRAVIQTGLKRPVELLFNELKTKAEVLAVDVSKRKLAERALRQAQSDLERRVEERRPTGSQRQTLGGSRGAQEV